MYTSYNAGLCTDIFCLQCQAVYMRLFWKIRFELLGPFCNDLKIRDMIVPPWKWLQTRVLKINIPWTYSSSGSLEVITPVIFPMYVMCQSYQFISWLFHSSSV